MQYDGVMKWLETSKYGQFIRFGIVGVSNTAVNYVVYAVSLSVMNSLSVFREHDYLIAQIIAFLLSVLWSFFLNRKFVFRQDSTSSFWGILLKTYASYAFSGLLVSSVLLAVWIEYLGIHKMIAPLLNLVITVPLNFFLNKYWAFR